MIWKLNKAQKLSLSVLFPDNNHFLFIEAPHSATRNTNLMEIY